MSSRCLAPVLAFAGGCSALFGIDHVSTEPDVDAAPDALDPNQVSVVDEYVIAANGTHVTEPLPYAFAARAADGTGIPSTTTQTMTDTRVVFDVPPGARYALDVGGTSEYQSTARELHLTAPWIGRFDAPTMQASTTIDVTVSQSASSVSSLPILASTGVRAQSGVAQNVTASAVYDIDYSLFTAIGNAPIRVPSATAGDRLYFSRLQLTATMPFYFAPTSAGSASFTLVDGAQHVPFAITATPQTLDHCFTLVVPMHDEIQRAAAAPVAPASWTQGAANAQWQILSTPDVLSDGPFGGLVVARSDTANPESNFNGQVCYHSIFAETEFVLMFANRVFNVALAGALPATTSFIAGISAYLPIDPTMPSATIDFTPYQIPVQGTITLAGVPLLGDHATPTFARTASIALDIPVAVAGNLTPTDYGVTLWELTAAGIPVTTIARATFSWSVTTPHVLIDPAKLATGHHYVFQIVSRVGYPDAPDYRHVVFPYIGATTWSTDFTAP